VCVCNCVYAPWLRQPLQHAGARFLTQHIALCAPLSLFSWFSPLCLPTLTAATTLSMHPTHSPNLQVAISDHKSYADRPEVTRIASSNGSWDHLAVNKMAKQPMGTGTAPPPPGEEGVLGDTLRVFGCKLSLASAGRSSNTMPGSS
jgi:hypothetical protein